MNDKDRDRSGDGAGPVAEGQEGCRQSKSRRGGHGRQMVGGILLLLTVFFMPVVSHAQLRGLSLTVDVSAAKFDNKQANFYNGNPDNANTLERILYSETYGNQIWNNLTDQNLIGSSVQNYREIRVAAYNDMYYKLAIQLGLGFRYDFEKSRWGWLMRFDFAKAEAAGVIQLESGKNNAYLTNRDRYVNCPALGVERRIFIDFGVIHKIPLSSGWDMELSLGGTLNNTKVEKSDVLIAGATYSILDIWLGQSPSSYVGSYEYVNQGGIGFGGFAGVDFGFTLPVGTAMHLGYTIYYSKTNLRDYNDFGIHHAIKLSVALNNFSFM